MIYIFIFFFGAVTAVAAIAPLQATTSFTLPFTISNHAFYPVSDAFYVSSGQNVSAENGQFSIAAITPGRTAFIGLTPQKFTVNGSPGANNPLFGVAIAQLGLLDNQPLAVSAADLTTLYAITETNLLSIQPRDAAGAITSEILSITGSFRAQDNTALSFFAAVAPHVGTFGDPGSGISWGVYRQGQLKLVNAANINSETEGRAAALDRSSPALIINADATNLSNPTLHLLNNIVFAGVHIVGNTGVNDGVRAVAVGRNSNNVFSFEPIVPEAAIGTNSIIGARGTSAEVSIHTLAGMDTSTTLNYLIVLGGVGTPAATNTTVSALPITPQGAIAASNSSIQTRYFPLQPYLKRSFTDAADSEATMPAATDTPVMVGAGPAPAEITDLNVVGDTVFIATKDTAANALPGIFQSQALFDVTGKIKGWTAWRRCAASAEPVFGFAIDPVSGMSWKISGASELEENMVIATSWGLGNSAISRFVTAQFSTIPQKIQGVFDVPLNTPSLTTSIGSRLSLTIATGYQRIVIAQSGHDVSSVFTPEEDFSSTFQTTTGDLSGFVPGVTALTMSGGILTQGGALIAATVAHNDTFGWFVAGGNGGLYILCAPDGSGFATPPELAAGFNGLSTALRWKPIGSYKNVRKLIAQDNNLYVLTDTQLDRVAMTTASFADNATLVATPIARATGHERFSDILIAGPLGVLASDRGLFFSSGIDVRSTTLIQPWKPLPLFDGPTPVSRLFAVSPTPFETDLMTNPGGNFLALASYTGYHLARVYRFTVTPGNTVTDTTVQQLPDFILKNKATFKINVGNYRNFVITDGALTLLSRSKYLSQDPLVESYPPFDFMAAAFLTTKSLEPRNIPLNDKKNAFGPFAYQSARGVWQLASDSGLYSLE